MKRNTLDTHISILEYAGYLTFYSISNIEMKIKIARHGFKKIKPYHLLVSQERDYI